MLDKDSSDIVGFLGSVGDDYCGDLYSDLLQKEGIIPYFERIPKQNTGTCLVLCNHNDRAHITDLGASTSITEDYIKRVLPKFEDAILIFTELFIIKTQKDLVYKIAKMGLPDHKIYGFNLPSFYFLETFQNDIQELISYADILFANIDEAKFFCFKMGIDIKQSMEKIITALAKMSKKNKNKNRIVVITASAEPAWVCDYSFKENKVKWCKSYEVNYVPDNLIVDTNGAGDSFAGGFLSQYMKGKSIDECMKAGHWAASLIISQNWMFNSYRYKI